MPLLIEVVLRDNRFSAVAQSERRSKQSLAIIHGTSHVMTAVEGAGHVPITREHTLNTVLLYIQVRVASRISATIFSYVRVYDRVLVND